MNFDKHRITKIGIIGGIVLLIGLFAVVALVQKQQEIRSRATSPEVYDAFGVTDNKGNSLPYKDENEVRTYETKSLDVRIKVNDLKKLIENGQ